ncbi:MAG: PQQ-dependent sugar dehydrogenase [Verrucomicrobiaceae bacterium]|nr:PQQ-dependent sugar dehydrogenase [Verrucomicrobiaceae bacterium]
MCAALGGSALAQSGLASRQPMGAYLNGAFPSTSPGTGGGYMAEDAFPGVTFDDPIKMVQEPRSSMMWVITRQGKVWRFDKNSPGTTRTLVVDLASNTLGGGDSGLLGIALHPDFGLSGAAHRGHVYIWYSYVPDTRSGELSYNRLSRYTLNDGATTIGRSSELVMINQFDENPWHNGGDMFFGPDSFLYISVGDEGALGEIYNNAQKINDGIFSGVLRIDVNQDAARSHPIRRQPQVGGVPPAGWPATFTQGYYIPNDNPWVDPTGGTLEEFYAIGLRSPHRMSFDGATGKAVIGDVGQEDAEEIDVLAKAANYQWGYLEGTITGPKAKPASVIGTETAPILTYSHNGGGAAVIGGFVYRGSRLPGSLIGKYIFGDYVSGKIWSLDWQTPGAQPSLLTQISGSSLSGFSVDAQNELYFCTMGTSGRIYRLSSTGGTAQPPATLSATGAFSSLANLQPASGVIPYNVNSPLWTDNALKQRWIALPNDGAPYSGGEVINFSATGSWNFPVGTVLIKQFDLATNESNPFIVRRIETRFLVRGTDGWYGLTYKWRADGSNADLLVNGENMPVTITTSDGGTRTQNWTFPGRGDCMNCHTENAGWVLGPNTRQLNGNLTYPTTGITANQLATWSAIGMFDTPLSSTQIAGFTKTVPLTDTSASLETRTRSYLDSNCSHCHRPGGVRANWDARFDTPLANANIINGPLFNDLGVSGAKVVVPKDVSRSMMHIRLNSLADAKMPPLAKNVVDTAAVATIADWINSLVVSQPALTGADVGAVGASGSTSGSADHSSYTLNGSGSGIFGTADAFQYAWTTLQGDGEIRARVASQTNTNPWAKAGVMIRESLSEDSRHAVCFLTPENGFGYEFRAATAQPSEFFFGPASNAAPNNWIRIVRSGDSLSGYTSADGHSWTLVHIGVVPALQSTVYIGLVVTSSNYGVLSTASFDNVQLGGSSQQNHAPAITQPQDQFTLRGSAVSFALQASDPDGDILSWIASGLPAGLSIDPSTGVISGTVSASAAASNPVIVAVSDGVLSASASFTWSTSSSGGTNLTGTDVGVVGQTGSVSVNASTGAYTISGSGEDIFFNADGFQFAWRTLQGDGEIRARVVSQTNTNPWAKAGVMVRENLTGGSRHAMTFVTPENGFGMVWRAVQDAAAEYAGGPPLNAAPDNWVRLVRAGDVLTGFVSADGQSWTQVSSIALSGLPSSVSIGLAVTASDVSRLSTAVFDNVTIIGGATQAALTGLDIGAISPNGGTNFDGTTGTYSISASGVGITGTEDSFHFASTAVSGDCDIRARVTSLTGANPWAKAGVMIRESLAPDSRFGLAFVTTENGLAGNYRLTTGGVRQFAAGPGLNPPPNNWVRVVRTGNVLSGYVSADGTAWTPIFTTTISGFASTAYIGLAVTASDNNDRAFATFDNVEIIVGPITGNRPPVVTQPAGQSTPRGSSVALQIQAADPDGNALSYSATGLPAGLSINASSGIISGTVSTSALATNSVVVAVSDGSLSASASFTWLTTEPGTQPVLAGADVGAVAIAGSTSSGGAGSYTVSGSGDGIYSTADAFHFASTTLSGDGEIRARVTSLSNTNPWSKAGVMIRDSLATIAPFGFVFITPQNGFAGNYRTAAGGTRIFAGGPALNAAPNNWIRIVRAGNVLGGYVSADGANWTQIFATSISALSSTTRIGLAVTASESSLVARATFDNVQIITAPAAGALAGVDVGPVSPAGFTSFASGGAYTLAAAGDGIYGGADTFHFAQQRITGDGEIKARITSITNSNMWTKAGVMIRADLSQPSAFGLSFLTPQNGFAGNYRTDSGATRVFAQGPAANPAPNNWVRIKRSGTVLTAYTSANGTNWTQTFSATLPTLPASAYFGLALTSSDNTQVATATFDSVVVTGTPAAPASQSVRAALEPLAQPAMSWSQWLGDYEVGARGDNADGDYGSDLMEYALGTDPRDGGDAAGLRIEKQPDGRWSASIRHPLDRTDLSYQVEASADLATWTATGIAPVFTDGTDAIRTIAYPAIDSLLGDAGDFTIFFRLRVTHLSGGGTTTGEPFSLSRISFGAGSETFGCANVKPPLYAGLVTGVTANSVLLPTSLGGDPSRHYYLEVRDGAYAGHRFDIATFAGTAVVIDLASVRNTSAALPDLTGAAIVIRQHVTLDDVLDKSVLTGSRSSSLSDRVSFYTGGNYASYWLFNLTPADASKAAWVSAGDATLANAGARIIAPGEGMFVKAAHAASMIIAGPVRTNPFVQVLRPGQNFIARPFPVTASPASAAFNAANGFIASRSKTIADMLLDWNADTPGGAQTFASFWFAQIGASTYWTSADNATLTDQSNAALLIANRAVFLKRAGTTTTTTLILAPSIR